MNDTNAARGSCLCGAVKFTVHMPSKWCAHCHCSMCRKHHGAGYVTWVGFADKQFELQEGKAELSWYASSQEAQRGYCSYCGSSLFFRSNKWPGEIHIALGCMDDAIDRKPQAHVYHDTHVDWVAIDEALKIFQPDK